MTEEELARKIRQRFPGPYDATDDATLVSAVIKKYPVYQQYLTQEPPVVEQATAALKRPIEAVTTAMGEMAKPAERAAESAFGINVPYAERINKAVEAATTGATAALPVVLPEALKEPARYAAAVPMTAVQMATHVPETVGEAGLMGMAAAGLGGVAKVAPKVGPRLDFMGFMRRQFPRLAEHLGGRKPTIVEPPPPPGPPSAPMDPWTFGHGERMPVETPEIVQKMEAGVEPVPHGQTFGNKMRAIETQMYDRFTPIKRVEGSPEYTKSYVQARLLKGRMRGQVEALFNEVNDALGPVKTYQERRALDEIYVLKFLKEADIAGKTTSGVTADIANQTLADLQVRMGDEAFKRLEAVADNLAKLQNERGLKLLVDSKIMTEKAAKTLQARYPHYMRSEIMDEELVSKYPTLRGANAEPLSKINVSFLKTKRGTELQINTDVLNVIRRSLMSKVAAAEKQKVIDVVAKEFGTPVGLVKRNLDLTQTPKTRRYTASIPRGMREANIRTTDGTIYAMPEDVADMVEGLNKEQADILTKTVSLYNQMFRTGATTYRLPFMFTNLSRDIKTALFTGRGPEAGVETIPQSMVGRLAKSFVHAIKDAFGFRDEVMQKFKTEGAAYGGLITSVPGQVPLPFRLRSGWEQVTRAVTAPFTLPFETISRLAEASDNTTRLAEFLRFESSKHSPEFAAMSARDLTVDFEKSGDVMTMVNRWVPFLNASLQGQSNVVRAMRDQPKTSIARLGALTVIPAASIWAWNSQQWGWDKVQPWIKSNYWILNLGSWVRVKNKAGEEVPLLITIRKNEMDQPFGNAVESLLDTAYKTMDGRRKIAEFTAKNVVSDIAYGAINLVTPPPFKTGLEVATGFDLFRRQPIVKEEYKKAPPELQTGPQTADIYKLIGERTKTSPALMEHAISGAFPASRQVAGAADIFMKLFGIKTKLPPTEGKSTMEQIGEVFPFVKVPAGTDPITQRIYDISSKIERDKTGKMILAKRWYDSFSAAPNDAEIKKRLADAIRGLDPEQFETFSQYVKAVATRGGPHKRAIDVLLGLPKTRMMQVLLQLSPEERGSLSPGGRAP